MKIIYAKCGVKNYMNEDATFAVAERKRQKIGVVLVVVMVVVAAATPAAEIIKVVVVCVYLR